MQEEMLKNYREQIEPDVSVRRLEAAIHVDEEAGCKYRYIYSNTERFKLHRHEYYELFLTLSGEIIHVINGKMQQLQEGSLVFIRPDDIHDYICRQKGRIYHFVNLALSKDTVEQLFAYLGEGFPSKELLYCDFPPMVLLSQRDRERLLKRLMTCDAVNWLDKKKLKTHTRALLADIFTRYFANLPTRENSSTPLWLQNVYDEMKKPEHFSVGMERMVELSGRSREHLARQWKKYFHITMTEYIKELRITYAANMLVNSDMPIIDLCYECGFLSLSRFYALFKEKYHTSPKEYRRGHILREQGE